MIYIPKNRYYDPKTDIIQVNPVEIYKEYSIIDVMSHLDKYYTGNQCRFFLRNKKVVLMRLNGVFYKLFSVSEDSKGHGVFKAYVTGRYTLNTVLDKMSRGLIHYTSIPDRDVSKYIPVSVMEHFGYDMTPPPQGVPFIIGSKRYWKR